MLTKLFREFFESEKAGGVVLIIVTVISLVLANLSFGESYIHFWQKELGPLSIVHWINDGLMAVFFLMIGLELEREVYIGELSKIKQVSLPLAGALGGMVIPALIYLFINKGTNTQSGFGIPMATDIAFAIGILSILGNRAPLSLKIFLTALAVIDDLGAIIIIAVFYTTDLSGLNLLLSLGIWGVLLLLNRLRVFNIIPYLVGGVAMWYFMLHSGVHATITGVLLAFAIPFGSGSEQSVSYKLQKILHRPVAFIIIPLFALANTCIPIESGWQQGMTNSVSLGISAGLIVGKPLGITLFALAGVALGVCVLPKDIKWKYLIGAAMLGGIGFTMSIFIALLAFGDIHIINQSKIAVLSASAIAGVLGFTWLYFLLPRKKGKEQV